MHLFSNRIFRLISPFLLTGAAFLSASTTAINSRPVGLLETHAVFAVYGRGLGLAPILGRLGAYKDFDSMAAGIREFITQVASLDGRKPVLPGAELIYAMGIPCKGKEDCLDYLDNSANLIDTYIKPAAQRGFLVILDTQLGRSDPATQIRRMIEKGYLDYNNVHVGIDPEFHVYPGDTVPGTPTGTVTAEQINEAQKILSDYVDSRNLRTKKILIVHQFGDPAVHDGVPDMIRNKKSLLTYPDVELVIDADGLGTPYVKVHKYNLITSSRIYPCVHFRGIKVFFRSPLEKNGHYDKPPMTMQQVFGAVAVPGGIRIDAQPNVVIIA